MAGLFGGVGDFLGQAANNVGNAIGGAERGIGQFAGQVGNNIGQTLGGASSQAQNLAHQIVSNAHNVAVQGGGLINPPGHLNGVVSNVGGAVRGGQQLFTNAVNSVNNYRAAAADYPPFFNNTGNNPIQWLGKVAADTQRRGIGEGLQDLTYPISANPYLAPLTNTITGNIRVANYKAGRPNPIINALLGQEDYQSNDGLQRDIPLPGVPYKPSPEKLKQIHRYQ